MGKISSLLKMKELAIFHHLAFANIQVCKIYS